MKSVIEKNINKYLPSLKVRSEDFVVKNLPVSYREIYDFEKLEIGEKSYLVIKVKNKSLGPKDFKKHGRILSENINYPQIWFMKELHAHKVRRMIENEMNFIIEDKHIYLPIISISTKAESEKVRKISKLTVTSINILIREVLKGDLGGKSKVEIAELFKTTKMTIGRALEPLLLNDLCEEYKMGVAKKIHFRSRNEIWSYLKNNIDSPLKEIIYIDDLPRLKALPFSGISALSIKSMLVDDEIPTLASEKKAFKKRFTKAIPVLEEFAKARIELWDRNPILQEDRCINVIDIYLILKKDKDERIQIELQKLLSKYELEV